MIRDDNEAAIVLDAGDTDMKETTFTSFTKLTFSLKEDRK